MEHWKPIVGYEGRYEVSTEGNVKSIKSSKVLIPQARKHGYLAVWLYKNGGRRQVSVHRLVAEAFCEKHDGDTEVNHLNEDKTDNRAENLEWCNHKYNTNYGTTQERRASKIRNGPKSRGVRQMDMDGNVLNEFPSLAEAFRQTGTLQSSICFMISGRYTHANGYKWEYI